MWSRCRRPANRPYPATGGNGTLDGGYGCPDEGAAIYGRGSAGKPQRESQSSADGRYPGEAPPKQRGGSDRLCRRWLSRRLRTDIRGSAQWQSDSSGCGHASGSDQRHSGWLRGPVLYACRRRPARGQGGDADGRGRSGSCAAVGAGRVISFGSTVWIYTSAGRSLSASSMKPLIRSIGRSTPACCFPPSV